jgi:divalent metal cation (Fe/Co/Zn/Cd) transporter
MSGEGKVKQRRIEVNDLMQQSYVHLPWRGAELNIAVASGLSVAEGHAIAKEVRHRLLHQFAYLSSVVIHVDPTEEAGEEFHRVTEHTHDGLPAHSH